MSNIAFTMFLLSHKHFNEQGLPSIETLASYPVLFLDSPPERGEEKRAWYTLTAHVQDLHPLAQDPWANGCTGSALGLYVPKAKISQEL